MVLAPPSALFVMAEAEHLSGSDAWVFVASATFKPVASLTLSATRCRCASGSS
jgi:hypothetical protein